MEMLVSHSRSGRRQCDHEQGTTVGSVTGKA